MKNSKSTRTNLLVALLLGLLVVAYKVVFTSPANDQFLQTENTITVERVNQVLGKVESIRFDTSVTQDPKFRSLNSIEIPLPSLPLGKKNPFSAN